MFHTPCQEYIVAGANRSYKAVDGVLYSYDGRELINYPEEKIGEKYAVIPGAETLLKYTITDVYNLKELSLPTSLELLIAASLQDMGNLKTIICEGITPPTFSSGGRLPGALVIGLKSINVPEGANIDDYAQKWSALISSGYTIVSNSDNQSSGAIIGDLDSNNDSQSGTWPSSFNRDYLHPNTYGAKAMAILIRERMQELGYLD